MKPFKEALIWLNTGDMKNRLISSIKYWKKIQTIKELFLTEDILC
jgi:hypothetical protein